MINELKRIRKRLETTERTALWDGTNSNVAATEFRSQQASFAAGLRLGIDEITALLQKLDKDDP